MHHEEEKQQERVEYDSESSVETEDTTASLLTADCSRSDIGDELTDISGGRWLCGGLLGFFGGRRGMSIRGTLRRFDRLFVPCYIRHLRVDVCIQQRRQSNRSSHADHRSQCEHKTDHNPRKVARYNCIYDHKEMLITKLFEAIDHASREEEDEEVQVHVE